jgi:hypothetical protein
MVACGRLRSSPGDEHSVVPSQLTLTQYSGRTGVAEEEEEEGV